MKKFLGFCIGAAVLAGLYLGQTVAATQYDPETEGVVSGYLCIDGENGYITGIAPGATVEELNSRSLPGDLTTADETLATGTVLTSQAADRQLTAIVTGDLNGDGDVTISDMLMVKSYILGAELETLAMQAGDVNYDQDVTISDFLGIKSYLLGRSDIGYRDSSDREPLILLAPTQSQSWNMTAAAYRSDNEEIATVDETGKITAAACGTTFVYALDEAQQPMARTAVTVLEGGLTVTADKDTYALCPDQQLQVSYRLNHPVSAALTWETADGSICAVDQEGVMTGGSFGDTKIRATLPGGGYAEVEVRVMPEITEMDFENHLYKLKPNTTKNTVLNLQPLDAGEEVLWTSSDPSIATVESGVITGYKYGTVTVTATGRYTQRTASCTVKVCNLKQVAITFDDGPGGYTPKLLDFLKENEIKATFFVVGQRMDSYKSSLKRIVDEGHELGYHSYSHKQQTSLTTAKIISDFESCNQKAIDITGAGFTLWRTPGGGYNQRVLDAVPLPHIMWTVDTLDWKTRNTTAVYNSIIKSSDDGEIILLHDIHKTSVEGAIKAMKEMQAGDYEFLTVTELLSRNGTPPQPSTSYKKAP